MAKKKINDDTLLQLILGWKQPGRGSGSLLTEYCLYLQETDPA
ncbi:MAG: hypothetical protein ACLQVJ_10290 [Syntrophobacteraceae bacterium]